MRQNNDSVDEGVQAPASGANSNKDVDDDDDDDDDEEDDLNRRLSATNIQEGQGGAPGKVAEAMEE